MAIRVELDGLAADGAALAAGQAAESPAGCEPASAHPTSVGVAEQLSARSASLTAFANNGQRKRAEGGVATRRAAEIHRAADEAGAAVIAGTTSTAAVVAPMTAAAVPDAMSTPNPPMSPLVPMTGEAHAVALHTGPGSASLRAFGDHWRSQAAAWDKVAAETAHTAASIDTHWSDD